MKNRGKAKRMSKKERREQILNAAMSVFVERGFVGSTTLEIAKAAGVSEVTLFRYFSSKQEIFLEGIKPILLSTLEESINTASGLSPEMKLEHILYERISLLSRNHQIVRLILAEAPLLSELGNENFIESILSILDKMLINIGIPIKNEAFTLRLLMGSILSFLFVPDRDEESIKSYVNKLVSLILNKTND